MAFYARDTNPNNVHAAFEFCAVELVMMAVDQELRAHGPGQISDDLEAKRMALWGLVRDQDIDALQGLERLQVFGEDDGHVVVSQHFVFPDLRQALPGVVRPHRPHLGKPGKLVHPEDALKKGPTEACNAHAAGLDDLAMQISGGHGLMKFDEARVVAVVVSVNPPGLLAQLAQLFGNVPQRLLVAEQDDEIRVLAGLADRPELTVAVPDKQDPLCRGRKATLRKLVLGPGQPVGVKLGVVVAVLIRAADGDDVAQGWRGSTGAGPQLGPVCRPAAGDVRVDGDQGELIAIDVPVFHGLERGFGLDGVKHVCTLDSASTDTDKQGPARLLRLGKVEHSGFAGFYRELMDLEVIF